MESIVFIFGIVLLIVLAESWRENHTFRTTYYQIQSGKLNRLQKERKVIMLSDLHNHCYGEHNQKLLDAIRKENPDLILIAGDMLVGKEGISPETARKFVSALSDICEVYYSNGNHEQRMKENVEKYGDVYAKYQRELKRVSVHFLENEKATLLWDGVEIDIYGLEIPQRYYKKFEKMELPVEDIEHCVGRAVAENYEILLAHNPIFAETYMKWGADLILSGHLHGGIVRVPKLGGVITPQMKLFPKYSGELTVRDEKAVVVSKGLGTHTFCFRFWNPAEMIVLQIGRKNLSKERISRIINDSDERKGRKRNGNTGKTASV